MTTQIMTLALGAVLFAQPATPQQDEPKPEPKHYFTLAFSVKEIEAGKTVNIRSFSMTAGTERGNQMLRTGGRVPYVTSGGTNFLDVGVNIDCRNIREQGANLLMNVSAEVSSVSSSTEGQPNAIPTIRQNRWNSEVTVPLKKAVVVFSSDDLASKRTMQLEVTVTPIQ